MNDNYQNYEIIGSYFTAGEDTPMYFAQRTPSGWLVNPKPYDTLKKGKTWMMKITEVFNRDGVDYFLTTPHYNAKVKTDVTTVFKRGDSTIHAIVKDKIHDPNSSYYAKPDESIFERLGGNIKMFVMLGLAAWVASSYFKGRNK